MTQLQESMGDVLASINSREELEGVLMVLNDPALRSKPMTDRDWEQLTVLKKRFGV